MVYFPFKRIFGLIGSMRVGKDEVANFLIETRGFKQVAFADQIKEEFGISKEDFEAAKIAGNIDKLRKELWAFSAEKKKNNPNYFIKKVINNAEKSNSAVIITDIRTEEELAAFYNINSCLSRIYWVRREDYYRKETDEANYLKGSKLTIDRIVNCLSPASQYDMRCVHNKKRGLYAFYQDLDYYFFREDILDIWNDKILSNNITSYLDQFEIKIRRKEVL